MADSWCLVHLLTSMQSQQSITVVAIKVSSHPPDLIFLVGIPSTSEDVGNSFHLADTSPTQQGTWKRCTLNSRFFQPVVSIPHASLGAKRSSSALLLSSLTGRMRYCTWPLSWLPPPSSPLPRRGTVPPLHHSTLIVHSFSPSYYALTPPPRRAPVLTH